MLSTLSKLADKNFVVGYFVPTLLGLIAVAWTFPGLLALAELHNILATDDVLKKLIYVGLPVWFSAIILMTANYWLYRIFEGYLPPAAWLWFRTKMHKGKLRELQERSETEKNDSEFLKLRLRLQNDYPPLENLVKPTKFGNRIQAFEAYPALTYGADAVGVWPRLTSVIPKDFLGAIEDARAQVNFYMNISFLAGLLFIVDAVVISCHLAQQACLLCPSATSGSVPFEALLYFEDYRILCSAVLALIMSFLSYRFATSAILGWGELIRAAFDCYLPRLIAQLGYKTPPRPEDRKRFWTEFSQLVLYGDRIGPWPVDQTAETKGEENRSDRIDGSPGDPDEDTENLPSGPDDDK